MNNPQNYVIPFEEEVLNEALLFQGLYICNFTWAGNWELVYSLSPEMLLHLGPTTICDTHDLNKTHITIRGLLRKPIKLLMFSYSRMLFVTSYIHVTIQYVAF